MPATSTRRFVVAALAFLFLGASPLYAFRTVVIDPGHGGRDLGAADSYVYEKHISLDVARRLERTLQQAGFRTVMTRTRDEFIALSERAAIANRQRNAIFVSIHFNSSYRTSAQGIETFYRSAQSEALARAVQTELVRHIKAPDRGVKTANFVVLRQTKHPAILVEGGFISNQSERSAMIEPGYRQLVADCIAQGIIQYRRRL